MAAGMFTAAEVGFLVEELAPLDDPESGESGPERACAVSDIDGTIDGVVYYRREEAADAVWDLTMIAVDPRRQRHGVGRQLMDHVEEVLSGRGARLLAVRTSGTAQYAGARKFYERAGYTRAARIPDWWTDGDDLVMYVKRLTPGGRRS